VQQRDFLFYIAVEELLKKLHEQQIKRELEMYKIKGK